MGQVITITPFGRSLVDDADAVTARTTLALGNVDNTSDASKPVSTAQQTAIDLKANITSPIFITSEILGGGDGTASPAAFTARGPAAAGADIPGAVLTVDAPNGTGAGGAGAIIVRTAPVAASSSTPNVLAERLRVTPAGLLICSTPSSTNRNTLALSQMQFLGGVGGQNRLNINYDTVGTALTLNGPTTVATGFQLLAMDTQCYFGAYGAGNVMNFNGGLDAPIIFQTGVSVPVSPAAFQIYVANATYGMMLRWGSDTPRINCYAVAGQTANIQNWWESTGTSILAAVGPKGSFTTNVTDTTTTAVLTGLTIGHNSSATPAATFGVGLDWKLKSSTTTNTIVGRDTVEWVVATHASRTARRKRSVYDTAERETIREEADGAWGIIGIGGAVTALTQMTINCPAATYLGLVVKRAASPSAPAIQLQTSAGASLGNVGGTIFTDFVDGASTSVDGTFNDLFTHTTAANTFAINGDTIRGRAALVLIGHATATRQIKLVFAGTTIFDTTALTCAANANAVIDYSLIRVSPSVVRYAVTINAPGLSAVVPPAVGELTGLTLTGTNILKLTGAAAAGGAASGDITAKSQFMDRGEAA